MNYHTSETPFVFNNIEKAQFATGGGETQFLAINTQCSKND